MLCSDFSLATRWLRAVLLLLFSGLFVCLASPGRAALVTEFPIPATGSQPETITLGPDGAFWFTAYNGNYIGRMTTSGVVSNFNVLKPSSQPYGIAVGPDNNLWFTEFNGNKIGCIGTNGILIGEFPLPTLGSRPAGITRGPDDRLWFAERDVSRIGAIATNAFTAGATNFFSEYTTNNGLTSASYPFNIASGPDGNLWFTESAVGKIGQITPAGVVHEFKLNANCQPFGIVAGADGALWFTEYFGNKIGRISPTGVTNEYPVPTAGSGPYGLTLGKDGNIWFAEYLGGRIGRLATNGTNFTITEFVIPSYVIVTPNPSFLASQPDGTIWFSEVSGNNIGRIADNPLMLTVSNIIINAGSTFSGKVASFLDSDPVPSPTNLYSATINWGDGTTNSGTIITNTSGGFKVNGAHTYAASHGYIVTVTITDLDTSHDMGGATATASFSINLPPTLNISGLSGARVLISWPTNIPGFQLQASTTLTTTNWVDITNLPTVTGTNFTLTNTVPGNRYYRLKR